MLRSLFNATLAKFAHESASTEVAEIAENKIAITQTAGQENFTLNSYLTYADPDPIKTANTEKFNVAGTWKADGTTLDHVLFSCKLQGVTVFQQQFECTVGSDLCDKPATASTTDLWTSVFTFDVPGIAPPFEYFVTVEAFTADDASLFVLESNFYI